ncbi:histidine kinase [Aurantibacter crassamenti]|uniref:histidine kinase n=1 Tax=Aurantibacter crassamenti TaxID=1837375 RepID=UPI0019396F8D|nr:sensor histidine kinase [Aurantibacter crassamenti]MBM1107015.1 histidine kinase [Aurantibacter crassamenti]
MNLRFLLFFLLMLMLEPVYAQDPVFKIHSVKYKIGDQADWSAKALNDAHWIRKAPKIQDNQILWYRYSIDILKAPESLRQYGIQLEAYGEYEIFWDGIMIGKNGNPGQEGEMPSEGELWTTFSIPNHLSNSGNHVLALRASLHYFPDHTRIDDLEIDYYDDLLTRGSVKNAYMHIFAGAFLITSLYFFFLFLSNKKAYSTLVFSICCFLVFALTLTVYSKGYIPMHYSLHVIRLQIISTFLLGISFLIPFYFSMQFPYPRQKIALFIYGVILLSIFFLNHHAFDFKAFNMVVSMWFFSFGIVLYGGYKKIKGARLVLLTLLLSLGVYFATSFSISLYVGLGLILLGMLYLLSINIKEQRLAYENSLVQSSRLRLELLKKNIQPHFLMNTLTSLIDWIEEAPKKGVLFIEALAKEFDLINQMENKTLVPISQEIELCRTHLEIMKYRKEINYSWIEEGIDFEQKIPPAVLHTLLENGITHSLPLADNSIKFKLLFESKSDYNYYTFLTIATTVKDTTNRIEEGTGLKYIKARLTESYQTKWDFSSEPTRNGWKNVIKIYS